MTKEDIKTILDQHKLWLQGNGGTRADLRGADLTGAYLRGADLRGAVLTGAVLTGAYLRGADLRGADLTGAYLRGADLRGADLRGAVLTGAVLTGADLRGADLTGADLRGAVLTGAVLAGADLRGADLRGADLTGAVLRDAELTGTVLPHFQICPEEGGFYARKKTTLGVIKIYIPADAQRTSSLVSRKCRASHVKVISGEGCGGKSPAHGGLVYTKGAAIHADKFDPDIRLECTNGIHFFMTKREAEEWA